MKRTHLSTLLTAASLAAGLGVAGVALAQPYGGGPPDGPPPRDAFDGPGPDDRHRGRPERPDREEMMAVLRDIDPALAERVAERGGRHHADGDRPERGHRGDDGLRELFPQVARLTFLRERDPALYDLRVRDIRLERDTEALVAEARRVRGDASIDDAEDRIEDLHEELEEKVEAHFELRQEIRAAELERMEERLERLKEDLDRREGDKDELIAQRIAELRGGGGGW